MKAHSETNNCYQVVSGKACIDPHIPADNDDVKNTFVSATFKTRWKQSGFQTQEAHLGWNWFSEERETFYHGAAILLKYVQEKI